MRSVGLFCLLMGIGFDVFAVWAYFEVPRLLRSPYFLGVFAVLMFSALESSVLSRRNQFPRPAEQDQRQ